MHFLKFLIHFIQINNVLKFIWFFLCHLLHYFCLFIAKVIYNLRCIGKTFICGIFYSVLFFYDAEPMRIIQNERQQSDVKMPLRISVRLLMIGEIYS